ncbi:MAG: selenocysteine-specific translation elongation factor [Synergistaceae bacterium]|jgi:selenocysteine-specific elongation factor|nr:selenocysteine-specific translation elongation factor [Synergistaceae bacterium]
MSGKAEEGAARNIDHEISLVIGTAGHIDHGKTTLVKALTGVDCDRLMEEKKRGITIELGFAPLRLRDGRVVSVIDVPGHERFIRQMVAGASGVDAILLVVSADESVMPQTREHLAILELLGVRDGVVALTKADRVEPEMAELAGEDVRTLIRGTFLEGKPVIPVSGTTGQNLDALERELAALVDRIRPRPRRGAFFLPIDRAFPIAGFGTVVTGTAYRGVARPGDEVEILPGLPSGRESRIRSLQVHGRPVEAASAGQRVAVNLSGIAVDALSRGDVVCRKEVYSNTRCFDAILKVLPSAAEPLKHWQRVRLCIGTSDVLARVSLLESRSAAPGNEAPAQLVAEEDIVCTADQRFIIRFYSPLVTIGGGRVVFPYAHKPRGAAARRLSAERVLALSRAASAEERFALLAVQRGLLDFDSASAALQEPPAELEKIASRVLNGPAAITANITELRGEKPVYLSRECLEELAASVSAALAAYHSAFGSEAGMPLDDLARADLKRPLDSKAARALFALLAERGTLVLEDGKARLPGFAPQNDDAFLKSGEALLAYCRQRGFQPPTLDELREALNMEPRAFSLLVQNLRNSRKIALLPGKYILSGEVEEEMKTLLRGIKGEVTLAAVRDLTGSSRKFILPILEYFDSKGCTRRVGDVRVVKTI